MHLWSSVYRCTCIALLRGRPIRHPGRFRQKLISLKNTNMECRSEYQSVLFTCGANIRRSCSAVLANSILYWSHSICSCVGIWTIDARRLSIVAWSEGWVIIRVVNNPQVFYRLIPDSGWSACNCIQEEMGRATISDTNIAISTLSQVSMTRTSPFFLSLRFGEMQISLLASQSYPPTIQIVTPCAFLSKAISPIRTGFTVVALSGMHWMHKRKIRACVSSDRKVCVVLPLVLSMNMHFLLPKSESVSIIVCLHLESRVRVSSKYALYV